MAVTEWGSANVQEAFVHFPVFVGEDAELYDFGREKLRVRFFVALHNTEQDHEPLPDASGERSVSDDFG